MPEISLPEGSLHYEEEGSGSPVVLLHALGGNAQDWDRLLPSLRKDHRLLIPEMRGHGRSPAPRATTYTPFEHARDLHTLLGETGAGPCWIVGLSHGGFVALALALEHPEDVRGLVLVSTTAHVDRYTREVMARWLKVFQEQGLEAYLNRLVQDVFSPDWLLEHLDEVDQLKEQERHRRLAGIAPSVAGDSTWDVRGRIAGIRRPTLVVHGMDDQVIDPTSARILRQTILGSEMKLYANTGHLIPIEKADEFGPLVAEFLSRREREGETRPPP
jgi:pimeloyl-ACP methyl ester carboxylesterase